MLIIFCPYQTGKSSFLNSITKNDSKENAVKIRGPYTEPLENIFSDSEDSSKTQNYFPITDYGDGIILDIEYSSDYLFR